MNKQETTQLSTSAILKAHNHNRNYIDDKLDGFSLEATDIYIQLNFIELIERKRYGADQQQLATHKHRNVDSKINIKYRAVIARNFFGTLILD